MIIIFTWQIKDDIIFPWSVCMWTWCQSHTSSWSPQEGRVSNDTATTCSPIKGKFILLQLPPALCSTSGGRQGYQSFSLPMCWGTSRGLHFKHTKSSFLPNNWSETSLIIEINRKRNEKHWSFKTYSFFMLIRILRHGTPAPDYHIHKHTFRGFNKLLICQVWRE